MPVFCRQGCHALNGFLHEFDYFLPYKKLVVDFFSTKNDFFFAQQKLTMPSSWRHFCCISKDADDQLQNSASNSTAFRRPEKWRPKSGNNTWTRRSLLEHEQTELMEVPVEQIAYQMRPMCTPTYEYERLGDKHHDERKSELSDQRSTHDVSDSSLNDSSFSHVSKTTFPWMDEKFVPNERSGTRLGVSSVHLNAKRRQSILKNNPSDHQNSVLNNSPTKAFAPYKPLSVSFKDDEHVDQKSRNYVPHVINPNYIPSNFRNVQHSRVIRNEISAAPKFQTHTTGNMHVYPNASNNFDHRMVLKAPISDIGVRRIHSHPAQPHRQENIPKLEEYTGYPIPKQPWMDYRQSDHARPTVMEIFPPSDDFGKQEHGYEDNEVFYWSEVTYQKPETANIEVNLKRADEPGMFFPKMGKYERIKSHSTKTKQKPKTKSDKSRSESMYGYVPKVVQNVHTSTALEGTQIDDFFRQKLYEQNSQNFASWNDHGNDSDEEPFIITTTVDSTENLAITDDEKAKGITGNHGNIQNIKITTNLSDDSSGGSPQENHKAVHMDSATNSCQPQNHLLSYERQALEGRHRSLSTSAQPRPSQPPPPPPSSAITTPPPPPFWQATEGKHGLLASVPQSRPSQPPPPPPTSAVTPPSPPPFWQATEGKHGLLASVPQSRPSQPPPPPPPPTPPPSPPPISPPQPPPPPPPPAPTEVFAKVPKELIHKPINSAAKSSTANPVDPKISGLSPENVTESKTDTGNEEQVVESFYFPGIGQPVVKKRDSVSKSDKTSEVKANLDTTATARKNSFKKEFGKNSNDQASTQKDTTDENENKVIMIDFPPNLKNDKKLNITSLKILPPLPGKASSEVGTSSTKVAANNFKEDEVLY